MWVRKIFLGHQQKELFNVPIKDLRLHNHRYFFKKFRMNPPSSYSFPEFDHISTPAERLCIRLRHLVIEDAHITIGLSYRLIPTTVGRIIRETIQVIWNCLVEKG